MTTIPPTPKALQTASRLAAREARKLDTMAAKSASSSVAAQACKVRFLVTRLDAIVGHHTGNAQVAPAVVLAEIKAVARLGVMRRNQTSMTEAISKVVFKLWK